MKSTEYYLLGYKAVYSIARQAKGRLGHPNIQFTIEVERDDHLPFLTAILPCRLWKNEGRRVRRHLQPFCYSHTRRTNSVVVKLNYADVVVTSFPFVDVELIGWEG
jgi:hypothetical protein